MVRPVFDDHSFKWHLFQIRILSHVCIFEKKIRLPIRLLCRIVYWRPTGYFIYSFSYWKYYNSILNIFWERSNIFYIHCIYAYCSFSIYPARWKNNFAKKKGRIWEQLRIGTDSFNTLLQNKNLFYTLCTHNISLIITAALRLFTACSILHQEIPLAHCFLFAAAIPIIRIIPIAHSDIGIREIVVGFLSEAIGSGLKAGVLITSIDRIFELLLTGLSVGIFRKSLITPKN